jgi:hypothetical protein
MINTGIKATPQFVDILSSVIGQMSDGIWENTRSMEKYWKSLDFHVDESNNIIIEDNHYVCANPVDFFANKIKQIIKIEIDDGNKDLVWARSCCAEPSYISRSHTITVGDCYKLYELLKGRNVSKYYYASYETYTVNVELGDIKFDISVEALGPYDAKARAIKKLEKFAKFTVTK